MVGIWSKENQIKDCEYVIEFGNKAWIVWNWIKIKMICDEINPIRVWIN